MIIMLIALACTFSILSRWIQESYLYVAVSVLESDVCTDFLRNLLILHEGHRVGSTANGKSVTKAKAGARQLTTDARPLKPATDH